MIKEFFKKLDIKAGLLHFVCNDRMVAFCHASIPQAFRTSYKKVAFTLAEVLITLGIIGVVAALTIPNLIKSYQKKVTVEKLKSTYAILQQAIRLSEADNGPISSWEILAFDGDVFFEKYLRKYLKIQNDEIIQRMSPLFLYLNNTRASGDCLLNTQPYKRYSLSNGVDLYLYMRSHPTLWMERSSEAYLNQYNRTIKKTANIIVDINGNKKPNKMGKDIFSIHISVEKGILFNGLYSIADGVSIPNEPNINREYIKNNNCNKNKTGEWCGLLIYLDGWKISKDYPW